MKARITRPEIVARLQTWPKPILSRQKDYQPARTTEAANADAAAAAPSAPAPAVSPDTPNVHDAPGGPSSQGPGQSPHPEPVPAIEASVPEAGEVLTSQAAGKVAATVTPQSGKVAAKATPKSASTTRRR